VISRHASESPWNAREQEQRRATALMPRELPRAAPGRDVEVWRATPAEVTVCEAVGAASLRAVALRFVDLDGLEGQGPAWVRQGARELH
jgi:hypothetical protein